MSTSSITAPKEPIETSGNGLPKLLNEFNKTLYGNQASQYEKLTGGLTTTIARQILSSQSSLPFSSPHKLQIHDNCAGPGILTAAFLSTYPPKIHPNYKITLTDLSPDFVSLCHTKFAHEIAEGAVEPAVADGQDLSKYPDATFDRSYTLFGVFFYEDRARGFGELYRTLKPRGEAVVTVWKSVGFAPLLDATANRFQDKFPQFWRDEMATKVASLTSGPQKEWEDPKVLEGAMWRAGFKEVEMKIEGDGFKGEGLMGLVHMAGFVGVQGEKELEAWGVCFREAVEEGKGSFVEEMEEGLWGVRMVANVAVGRK